ncbi:5-aminolevulinate synthase [Tsukamurella strandjordii]|uniref:5-aminolevulinic acid synthase n=1 Tax=Tsukamurella strandjordii TaxID=147577 RepID=A0AA90SN69_9ACTN|nr:5-aminolevulinate synthase [Tsukamurella strandjordii]MDP0399998.1 5-aminolevulinate synthase [Tsukamurella strandjordii]
MTEILLDTVDRYETVARGKLDDLRESGNYRTFANINRRAGAFPAAAIGSPAAEAAPDADVVVWCSNDYLAMAQHPEVIAAAEQALRRYGVGAGGSRNIGGTNHEIIALEGVLGEWFGKERALVFPTGYGSNDAALEALSLVYPDLEIFSDELNHASIIAGVRRNRNGRHVFRHNDVDDLRAQLAAADPAVPKLVVFESVYSMDGDIAPIAELLAVAKEHGALVFLDEVHAIGMYGPQGRGIAASLGLLDEIDIVQGTLAKSIGVIGGFIAGRDWLIDAIRSFAPGFIFTTALPPATCAAARRSVEIVRGAEDLRADLQAKTELLRQRLRAHGITVMEDSVTHILPVRIGDPHRCTLAARRLFDEYRIYVQPINPPTVPEGTSRFRINVTPAHTYDHIEHLATALGAVFRELGV